MACVDDTVDDLDEIFNWMADQLWCDGNIGMFGDSVNARIHFIAATTGNPHLKAILPATTWMDNYSAIMFPGGVPNLAFVNIYPVIQYFFDKMATPVDDDTDGALLAQARAERGNMPALAEGAEIEAPGSDVDFGAEAQRWFDYWLKGINNGIMHEPPILYYLQGAEEYQSTDVWPLEGQTMTRYYFGPGESTGKVSVNDGTLDLSPPTDSQAFDPYTVDYSTTTGTSPHWTGLAFPHKYPNMRSRDSLALTYTTPPLAAATNIIGHPVIHLWLSTEAPDLDVFVYLEEVDGRKATYITQGILRASHRTPGQAPFENLGLPWFDHFESELQPIPAGEPFELVFDLFPTAYQFSEGNQIRITVAFADAGNFDTPILDPAPTLEVLRNTGYPTYVELPVVHSP